MSAITVTFVLSGLFDYCNTKSSYSEFNSVYPFELQALPYSEDFLSPFLSADTVVAHYEHHHQGYIDKLNAYIEENEAYQNYTLVELNEIYAKSDEMIGKFAGGAYNHYLYWYILTVFQCAKTEPEGPLAASIVSDFESFDNFITVFNNTLGRVWGSGWVWACVNLNNTIEIRSTINQQNPLMGLVDDVCYPFLGADTWEHAYYLDYRWEKQEYYNNFFYSIDWDMVEFFYESYAMEHIAIPF